MGFPHAIEMEKQGYRKGCCLLLGVDKLLNGGNVPDRLFPWLKASIDVAYIPALWERIGSTVFGQPSPLPIEAGGERLTLFDRGYSEVMVDTDELEQWKDLLAVAHERSLTTLVLTEETHVEPIAPQPSGDWVTVGGIYWPIRDVAELTEYTRMCTGETAEDLWYDYAHMDEEGRRTLVIFPPEPAE